MLKRFRLLSPDNGSNPSAGDPQAGDPAASTSPPAGTQPTPEPQAGDDQEPISQEAAKKLRSEANALRKREKDALAQLKTYQDKEQQAQDAQLPEIERLKKQVSDAESVHDGLIEQLVDREVRLQAAELGVKPQNLKYVAKLIWDDLEFDETTGMPTNVDALLKELLKELDLTDKRTASAGGATNPSRGTSSTAQLSWESITKMTPEQYAARQPEIQAWMRRNPPRAF
jgi:hypothetical protein